MDKKQTANLRNQSCQNESGKSMVEMLGVLALMGLLAILGAKGYNMAMERVASTRILNEVNRRSVVYAQQMMSHTELSELDSSEMPETIEGGYAFSARPLDNAFFTITVENVEKEVCAHMVDLNMKTALRLRVDGQISTGDSQICQKSNGTLEYTFSKLLTPCEDCLDNITTCSSNADCEANYECKNGVCSCAIPCGEACCSSGETCVNGACSVVQGCTSDLDCDNGICFSDGVCGCRSWRDCNEESYCVWQDRTHYTCSGRADIAPGSDTGPFGWMASSVTMRQETAADFCDKYGKSDPTAVEVGISNLDANGSMTPPDFLAWLGQGNYWIQGTDPWGKGSRALIYIHPNKKMNWGSFNLGYFYNKNYALCH